MSLLVLAGCAGTRGDRVGQAAPMAARDAVAAVLDDLHVAAALADEERYFSSFAPEAVFLGTDATERWPLPEFRAYAHDRFRTGAGWTYHPVERHIFIGPDGRTAWFDEVVRNVKYGDLRGTGVLVLRAGQWKIAQYNLTKPIPNDIFVEVVERIDAHAAGN